MTSGRSVDAGFPVVGNPNFPTSGSSQDADLSLIVDSRSVTSGRADDADLTVVGDADLDADAVFVVGVHAAFPLRATVGRIITRQRRQLRRFVTSSGRRRTRVLTRRAFGQIRAVASFGEFTRLHEETRRRLLRVGTTNSTRLRR